MTSVCNQIATNIGSLFSCKRVNDFIRIRTPFFYPDGDIVDLFFREDGLEGKYVFSDLGTTVSWLNSHSIGSNRTPKQKEIIEDVCFNSGVTFRHGSIFAVADSADQFAFTTTRLAQACIRVADVAYTFRSRVSRSITDDVADFLSEQNISFEQGQIWYGKSGRPYSIDFVTETAGGRSLIQVLATGTRAASRGICEHVVSQWVDIMSSSKQREPNRYISLFDDTLDVWSESDFNIVGLVSDISYWSKPNEIVVSISL